MTHPFRFYCLKGEFAGIKEFQGTYDEAYQLAHEYCNRVATLSRFERA